MPRLMCAAKLHRIKVTEANLDYEGSLTIDSQLLKEADMLPYEKVLVVNINNGARFETYLIDGEPNSGTVCLNGAAARLGQVGDLIIVMNFCWLEDQKAENHQPKVVLVDENNGIIS